MRQMKLTVRGLAAAFFVFTAVLSVAAQAPRLRASNAQVRSVLDRIRTKTATLQGEITRSRAYDSTPNAEERVYDQLTGLAESAATLRSATYSRNVDVEAELNEIMDRAARINRILGRNSTSYSITSQWTSIRNDVSTLARYYGMTWNWDRPYSGGQNGGSQNGPYAGALTGTYRLNESQSENVTDVIDRSIGYYESGQQDRIRRALERRLESPQVIAIDKRGRTITLASTNREAVTFEADGVARTETNVRGRSITTRATATNSRLTVETSGDRVSDITVTFDVDRSGRLRVTRRIYLENRNETVSVASVYDRTSQVADYSQTRQVSGYPNDGNYGGNTSTDFFIPNGTQLSATLRDSVSTKGSQVGDRFTLEVTSPSQYRGAMIEGRVTEAASSGRITGRANLQLDFDTISFNGRTYRFAGLIQSVTASNGDRVTVNNEGSIRDSNQTTKTATRAGIGAVIGAIIGGIAGGGSGAAIGAGVGAGAGAGTILIGGRDSIELGAGSTFTITASAPAGTANPRDN